MSILFDFLWGYRTSMILIAVGYATHFLKSEWHKKSEETFINMPYIVYPIALTAIIWMVMQLRNGEVQPFICFQF